MSRVPSRPQDKSVLVPKQLDDAPCELCAIVASQPPVPPESATRQRFNTARVNGWHVVLATEDVVAILDPTPLTNGQILVFPRQHRHKIGDMLAHECAEVYSVLPVLANAMRDAAYPNIQFDIMDYNIISANGPQANQNLPHATFTIVPRPPSQYSSEREYTLYPKELWRNSTSKYEPNLKSPVYAPGQLSHGDADILEEKVRDRMRRNWPGTGTEWTLGHISGLRRPPPEFKSRNQFTLHDNRSS